MADRPADAVAVPDATIWLFVLAGLLATVFGVNTYLSTFAGTFYEPVQAIVGPAGFLAGVLGLLTLYPRLADRTPMAHLAAVVVGITILAWVVILAGSLGEAVGVFAEQPQFVMVASLLAIVGMLLSFGITGGLAAWADDPSRLVGGLMLVDAAMFLLLVARLVPAYLIDTGHVLAFFGIAVALWYRTAGADRSARTAESTPRS